MESDTLDDVLGEPPVPPTAVTPLTHREFGDVASQRRSTYDNVVKSISERYPMENTRYRLEVRNLQYKDLKPFSINEQKNAIMQGDTLEHRLHGEWHLVDKASGNTVDKKAGVIAHIPYVTERGTYVYLGNEYTVANQMRLKPGVYTRQRDNGILEAHVNVKPGTGQSFRIHMEPETGVFRLGVGQSNLKLYPILRSMGATDEQLTQSWGKDLLQRNIEAEDPRAVARAFLKLVSTRADQEVGGEDGQHAEKLAALRRRHNPNGLCTLCKQPFGTPPPVEYHGRHFHRYCRQYATVAQLETAIWTSRINFAKIALHGKAVEPEIIEQIEPEPSLSDSEIVAKVAEWFERPGKSAGDFLEKMATPTSTPTLSHGDMLKTVFSKMQLDPATTKSTLGEEHPNVTIPTMLRITQKLVNVNQGKEETDDRDSLAYQTLHSAEDMFGERIRKDAGQLGRKLLWKSTTKGSVQHIPSGALTPQVRGVLLKSGLGMPIEEINPMDVYDQNLRVLRLGEGGITSLEAVPDEARNVQPSHFGYLDPIRAPESGNIGVDSRVAHGTVKGSDGQMYAKMFTPAGRPTYVSAAQAANSVVAFPGELEKGSAKVRAMVNSKSVDYVDRDKVHFALPHASHMFTATSNLVPLISGIKGGRLLMGAKYFVQALPLREAEAPLVQALSHDGKNSFDQLYGEKVGAVRARDKGVVHSMDKDGIHVMYADGQKETHALYNNFPFNRKTFLHNEASVKVGDQVQKGQLLARSNYTDREGTLAMGTNLRTAYMPYRGLNFEDAAVISESAAKKLASEHMYQVNHDVDDNVDVGRKSYMSMFPAKFKPYQLKHIGDNGVVVPGSVIHHGDPLILSMNKAKTDAVHRGHKPLWSDNVLTWDHHDDGVVTDVARTKEGGWNVTVKSYNQAQEGDKLAGRYGDKGVISRILPDDQMPHDKDGNHFHILLNPLGVISRVNPSQVYEALLGKIARKTGQPYRIPGFMDKSLLDHTAEELRKAGLSDTEDLTDPVTGKKIPKVLTGERFLMKLHHTAEAKGSGRDVGAYTSEGLPAKGGSLGAKRVSTMEQAALLSHGATEVLKDAQVVRGQNNPDYWRAFRMGLTPPSPKVPFIYNKFLGHLQGAGVNVRKDGNRLQIFALTDKDVDKMSVGEIKNGETVRGEKLEEVPGGLFDRKLTGGHGGERWSHIKLHEALPNPVMEEPIRTLLGLTQAKFEGVLSGKEQLGGKTGGEAIQEGLKRVNVDSAIDYYRGAITDGPRSKRDKAVKALGYLKGLQSSGVKPEELLLSKLPVLPPNMRPITAWNGMTMPADVNYLYKDLIKSNEDLRDIHKVLGPEHAGEERLRTYNALKAVTGLGDPVQPKTQEKGVKGLLAHVFGVGSPKTGMFQRRVLGSPVDVVGRGTITPNPDLNMDEVGIPEQKAWTIYRPFIMRRLIRKGMPATAAAQAVASQSDLAKKEMEAEMGERPVIINRAPTLHRYGFMAAWPKLVKNETLQIPPVVCAGFNADFDGDAMNYHVPVTDGAVKDAIEKMMPSRNLRSARDFKVHYTPKNEFLLGLYLATALDNKNEARVFKDKSTALAAYKRGELDLGDRINVRD